MGVTARPALTIAGQHDKPRAQGKPGPTAIRLTGRAAIS